MKVYLVLYVRRLFQDTDASAPLDSFVWEADRCFRDAGTPDHHYTIDDEFMTVFCGKEAVEDFDPEKHDWLEVNGPNQVKIADFLVWAACLLGKAYIRK